MPRLIEAPRDNVSHLCQSRDRMTEMDPRGRARANRPDDLAHDASPQPPEAAGSSFELCASDDGAYAATYMTLEAGTFHRRQEVDVIIYLLSGSVHVTSDDGSMSLRIVAGEAVYLPRGTSAMWQVDLPSHKLVVSRVPVLCTVAS